MNTYAFLDNKKIISSSDLKETGLSYYQINKLVSDGILRKLNKAYYENLQYTKEESDFVYVHAYIPNGVICLMSAACYYNLTTYRPDCVEVAIHRNKKVTTLPDYPEIKLRYFNQERVTTGVKEIFESNHKIYIFDIEKTVIDIIYYRNKVGIEETKEVLVNYLNHVDRDINKLFRYAKKLKCEKILQTYLEVLL